MCSLSNTLELSVGDIQINGVAIGSAVNVAGANNGALDLHWPRFYTEPGFFFALARF